MHRITARRAIASRTLTRIANVEVGNHAFISGHCVVHQFVRVGELSLMRGLSGTSRDVPPYSIVDWQHRVRGVNVVGLKRAGFDERRATNVYFYSLIFCTTDIVSCDYIS